MAQRAVVAFCMPGRGHFRRVRSVVSGLVRRGVPVYVFTDRQFRGDVERIGGRFVDLFEHRAIDVADAESWPPPVRWVTFAGRHAEDLAEEVARLKPGLIVHDTFAVVAAAVANLLGIPSVNVCAGHAVVPARFLPWLAAHPTVIVSGACQRAVEHLRARCGMPDASPFAYVTNRSAHLNLYCEPPAFLDPADRAAFEPMMFYGSLPDPDDRDVSSSTPSMFGARAAGVLRMYVSVGTEIWDYRRAEAERALVAVVEATARRGDVRIVLSAGGATFGAETRARLARDHVALVTYADQWRVLEDADVFVTHHGLNSTHESVLFGVPMISYPFAWDQPHQAETCQRLGIAIPLAADVMGPIAAEDVDRALARLRADALSLGTALSRARAWEDEVIAERPAVLDRMVNLVRSP